jgi:hypothetical protein
MLHPSIGMDNWRSRLRSNGPIRWSGPLIHAEEAARRESTPVLNSGTISAGGSEKRGHRRRRSLFACQETVGGPRTGDDTQRDFDASCRGLHAGGARLNNSSHL